MKFSIKNMMSKKSAENKIPGKKGRLRENIEAIAIAIVLALFIRRFCGTGIQNSFRIDETDPVDRRSYPGEQVHIWGEDSLFTQHHHSGKKTEEG